MKKETLYIFIIGILLAGYGWLGWNVISVHEQHSTPTVCLIKSVTGLPCPSCGITRSLTELVEGNIFASLYTNPLGVFIAILLIVLPLWVVADYFRESDSFFRHYILMEHALSRNAWVVVTAVFLVASNWYWNITKGL
jgi:hypothetical protein